MSNGQGISSNPIRGLCNLCPSVAAVSPADNSDYCLSSSCNPSELIVDLFSPTELRRQSEHSRNCDCPMLILATQIWLWITRQSVYPSNSNEAASGILVKYLFLAPARRIVIITWIEMVYRLVCDWMNFGLARKRKDDRQPITNKRTHRLVLLVSLLVNTPISLGVACAGRTLLSICCGENMFQNFNGTILFSLFHTLPLF